MRIVSAKQLFVAASVQVTYDHTITVHMPIELSEEDERRLLPSDEAIFEYVRKQRLYGDTDEDAQYLREQLEKESLGAAGRVAKGAMQSFPGQMEKSGGAGEGHTLR